MVLQDPGTRITICIDVSWVPVLRNENLARGDGSADRTLLDQLLT